VSGRPTQTTFAKSSGEAASPDLSARVIRRLPGYPRFGITDMAEGRDEFALQARWQDRTGTMARHDGMGVLRRLPKDVLLQWSFVLLYAVKQ
jgi:hypothetical protein